MKQITELDYEKKLCGHIWEVIKTINILPNCSICDCYVNCSVCKKEGSGTVHLEGGIEK